MNSDCIFCKIVKKELPSEIIYEDEKVFAFLDINPVNLGHTLVISKDHFENLLETPDEIVERMMLVAKKIGSSLNKSILADGFNLGLNNGEVAGQVVKHVHLHVMPRRKNDGLKLWPGRNVSAKELKETADKIRPLIKKG